MLVKDVMTKGVEVLSSDSRVIDAARMMKKLDVGFIPVSDTDGLRLEGVVTDRDIALRCVAEGMDGASTRLTDVLSTKPMYCYSEDSLEAAAESMARQQIYRLVVLDDPDHKQLAGVVSMGDILRNDAQDLAGRAARRIAEAA